MQDLKIIVDLLKAENRTEVKLHRKVYHPWGAYDSIDMGDRFQVKRITVKRCPALFADAPSPCRALDCGERHRTDYQWRPAQNRGHKTAQNRGQVFHYAKPEKPGSKNRGQKNRGQKTGVRSFIMHNH